MDVLVPVQFVATGGLCSGVDILVPHLWPDSSVGEVGADADV